MIKYFATQAALNKNVNTATTKISAEITLDWDCNCVEKVPMLGCSIAIMKKDLPL